MSKKLVIIGASGHVVKFLGVQKNPYGFFKSCDIYVQPSYEEGYGITIAEAKLFQKTIILTPFGSAEEHIISDYNGIIAKDFTGEALFDELWNVLENPNVRNKFQKNLKSEKEMKNASFRELMDQKCKIAIVSQIQTMLMLPLLLLGFHSTALVLTSTILSILSLMVNMIYCL